MMYDFDCRDAADLLAFACDVDLLLGGIFPAPPAFQPPSRVAGVAFLNRLDQHALGKVVDCIGLVFEHLAELGRGLDPVIGRLPRTANAPGNRRHNRAAAGYRRLKLGNGEALARSFAHCRILSSAPVFFAQNLWRSVLPAYAVVDTGIVNTNCIHLTTRRRIHNRIK